MTEGGATTGVVPFVTGGAELCPADDSGEVAGTVGAQFVTATRNIRGLTVLINPSALIMVIEDSVLIVVMWESDVLDAFDLTRGQQFVLGQAPGAWPFPAELIGAESITLVDFTGKLPRGCATGLTLDTRQQLVARYGSFRVFAWLESGEQLLLNWRRPSQWFRTTAFFGASAALVSLALLAARYTVPTLADVDRLPFKEELASDIHEFAGASAVPEAPLEEPFPTAASEVFQRDDEIKGFSRCGGEFDMGTRSDPRVARYAVEGPRDNPDPHLSHLHFWGRRNGSDSTVGGLARRDYSGALAPVAPWGREDSLGTNEVSARGNLLADEIGFAPGEEESLGMTHVDGGQIKLINVEREPTPFVTRPARVVHTQTKVDGPLPVSAIEQALVASLERMRDCYRADPASSGDAEGRIDLKIPVNEDGTSEPPSVVRIEHVASTTATCILDQVGRPTFGAAPLKSEVTYPLFLIPGESQVTKTVARLELAPPIARANEIVMPCSGSRSLHSRVQSGCKR